MSVLPVPSFLDSIKEKGLRKAVYEGVDEVVTRTTAGMNIQDIREALRGEEPSRRPNPRLTPHADGFFLHIRPSFYHEAVTGIYPTFRLGFLSTYFFFVEIITGLFLMVFYTPSPDAAYANMLNILGNVPMGQFMRDLHRLGAELMVLAVVAHMLRAYFTGSYKRPRQFTWFTGSVLLQLTLFLSFSGYLLPWDQLAFWAVTIGTSMAEAAPPEVVGTNINLLLRGAPDIAENGLLRFYLLHVFAVPLLTVVFLFVHYYKVTLHGLSLPPSLETIGEDTAKRVPKEKRVYYIPDVLTTELMWISLVTFLMVLMVTWFFHAPLEGHANPQVTPLHTTAPWYFLWIQGMLKLGDKVFWGLVMPGVIFGVISALPYLDVTKSRRYAHRRVALTAGLIVTALTIILTFMGTPHYGVETAGSQETLQDLIPDEGVGPVRAIPYDELVITSQVPVFGTTNSFESTNTPREEMDAYLASLTPIHLTEDNLGELAEMFEDSQPHLYEVIVEFHEAIYDKYSEDLAHAQGYMFISQQQEGLRRVQLYVTWDAVDDAGETYRNFEGKLTYVHQEAEWHAH